MVTSNNSIENIQEIVQRLRVDYKDDANVQTVGFGAPCRNGKYEDGVCIIFYVYEKLPTERSVEAIGSSQIPNEIEGYATDVVAEHLVKSAAGQRGERKYDPLMGGVSSSNSEQHIVWFNGHGTLGVLATDNATGAPVGLSNWHVWADGGDAGDQIIQPGTPSGGDHVEAIGKVLACGPLVTSLIEWESPDPIAAILYGGAAAAAVAAAFSDYKDPNRRGQEATVPPKGELTERERVQTEVLYHDLPLPGYPFRTEAIWEYQRETDQRVMTHDVRENTVNAQFLLGKRVVTDKQSYQPGEVVNLFASIWDYQLGRLCTDYHVVAHLISQEEPDTYLRAVLQSEPCNKDPFRSGDDDADQCIFFHEMKPQDIPYKGNFDWLGYLQPQQQSMNIVDWSELAQGLLLPPRGIQFSHAPTSKITVQVVQFTSQPVVMRGLVGGQVIEEVATNGIQGEIHTLEIEANGLSGVLILGGGGEAIIIDYCIDNASLDENFKIDIPKAQLEAILRDAKEAEIKIDSARTRQCCFGGSVRIPYNAKKSGWDVYLTVQNVNNVADGTKPEVAAGTIGGHLLSSHTLSPSGCLGIMLLDHVFDVI